MSEVMNTPVVAEAVANASSYNWGGLIARSAILGVAIGVGWFSCPSTRKSKRQRPARKSRRSPTSMK